MNEQLKVQPKYVKVDVFMKNGKTIKGKINIIGHDRLTEFMHELTTRYRGRTLDIVTGILNGRETEIMYIKYESWDIVVVSS
jgi:hypothetical protein